LRLLAADLFLLGPGLHPGQVLQDGQDGRVVQVAAAGSQQGGKEFMHQAGGGQGDPIVVPRLEDDVQVFEVELVNPGWKSPRMARGPRTSITRLWA